MSRSVHLVLRLTRGNDALIHQVGTMAGISDDVENLRVNRGDFMNALEEVHPAFGVSEEELQQVIQNGIIHFDTVVDVSLHFQFISRLTHDFAPGTLTLGSIICGASPHIYSHAPRQHPPPWPSGIRQNRLGGIHCSSVTVPLH
jgi:hypothetical protein